MLKKITSVSINNIFVIILLVIIGIIAVSNYSHGTILSGWDTLHPEFDFPLAFKRAIEGVWREEQGLGALAGHSHMSDLPRMLFLWLTSFFLPLNLIRYVWVFFTLGLGTLGTYYFTHNVFNTAKKTRKVASFLGALYYLLNLGTVQNYYVPFEMFTVLFAMLPWLFLFAYRYLAVGNKKNLILFGAISIFATPMAYAATLFYAYLGSIVLFMGTLAITMQNRLKTIKRTIIILVVLFVTNAFWLLPNLYSIRYQSEDVRNSRINTLFSLEAFLSNEAYGDIRNVIIHKNFLFSWQEHDAGRDSFVELMDEWQDHLSKPYVLYLLYFSAAVVAVGVVAALITRNLVGIALILPMAFALLFLVNNNWPTAKIYTWLMEQSYLFEEGFRMPFTKFSILFVFFGAYYFSFAIKSIISLFEKIKLGGFVSVLLMVTLSGVLAGGVKPVFEGSLISPSMRTQIPQDYFDLQAYMKTQPSGRMAVLPIHTRFGWTYYSWDYEGGGPSFMPFLISQSILMRDYDRWSPYNENFYNEARFHFYQKDLKAFEKVLKKYAVDYILIDKSVINPAKDEDYLFVSEAEQMFADSSDIVKDVEFGDLTLYKTSISAPKEGLALLTNYSQIHSEERYSSYDFIYQTYGDYINSNSFAHPFVNFDPRNTNIERNKDKIIISQEFTKPLTNKQILIPDFVETEEWLPVDVSMNLTEKGQVQVTLSLVVPELLVNRKDRMISEPIQHAQLFTFPKDVNPSYIAIEDEVIPIPELNTSEQYIGSVLVKNDNEVAIKFFTSRKVQLNKVVEGYYHTESRWCSDPDKTVEINLKNGEFTITANEESMCWEQDLTLNKNTYVKIQYETKSTEGLLPWICITEFGRNGCVNKNVPDNIEKDGEWGRFTYDVSLAAGKYWVVFVVQKDEFGPTSVIYRNISFSAYTQLDEYKLNIGSAMKMHTRENMINYNEPISQIKVEIPVRNAVSENFTWLRGHRLPFNCERTGKGIATKKAGNNTVKYGAYGNAANCDYYDYLNLSHNIGYLLSINGTNYEGRGLKFYLHNSINGNVELEELISRGKFNEQYVVFPKNLPGKGYVINLETRSFGKISSVNELEDISFIPLPLNWLYNVRIFSKSEQMQISSNSQIVDSHKTFTYKYRATVNMADSNSVVYLNQGYDPGWKGYRINSDLKTQMLKLAYYFPWFFGEELEHVKVNSWSNGWIIGSAEGKDQSADLEIVIIYWPQHLQYFGFGLFVTGFLAVLLWPRPKYPKVCISKEHRRLYRKVMKD